jgi:hypothetical protein
MQDDFKNASSYKFFSERLNLIGASDIFISTNGLANSNKNIKFKYYSLYDTCCIYENCKNYFSEDKSYKTPCKVKEVQEVLKYKLNSDSIYQIIFSQADLESRSKLSGLKDIVQSSLKSNFWSSLGTVLAGTYGIFTFGLSLFILYLLSTLFICLTIFILLKVQNYLFNTSFKLANKIVFKNQECDKFHIVLFYFIIGFILWFTFYLIFRYDIFQQLFVFSKSISKEKECVLLYFILFITLIFKLTNQFIQKDKYKDSKWSCFRLLTLSYPLFVYSFYFILEIAVKNSNTSLENILLFILSLFSVVSLLSVILPKHSSTISSLINKTGSLTNKAITKYTASKFPYFFRFIVLFILFFYSLYLYFKLGDQKWSVLLEENILFVSCTLFFYFLIFLLSKLSRGTASLTSQMVKLINNKNGFKDTGSLFVFILQDLTIPFFFGSLLVALLQLTGLLNVLFQYLKI